MKTLHVNFVDESGRVYCHHQNDLIVLNAKYFHSHCFKCPYIRDTAGGRGVECEFDDHSKAEVVVFYDSAESEQYSQYAGVRMGIETVEQVDARLKGYGAETTDIYGDEEDEEAEDYQPPDSAMLVEDDAENLEVSNENLEISRS